MYRIKILYYIFRERTGYMNLIFKNIFKNELYLLVFIISQELIRILMNVRDDLAISFNMVVFLIVTVAILSVIEYFVKAKLKKT
jgi:hypothetical protein